MILLLCFACSHNVVYIQFYIETNRSELGEKISILCSVMEGRVEWLANYKVNSAPFVCGGGYSWG
jgi:hypothetical protein